MRPLLLLALLVPMFAASPSARADADPGCTDNPQVAALHHFVPVPPPNPAYPKLIPYMKETPGGRCGPG